MVLTGERGQCRRDFFKGGADVGRGAARVAVGVDASYPANSITLLVLPPAGCSASLHVNGDWSTGHVATVTVTNERHTAMAGWRVSWTWPGGYQVTKLVEHHLEAGRRPRGRRGRRVERLHRWG
jgi:hypothetical protein